MNTKPNKDKFSLIEEKRLCDLKLAKAKAALLQAKADARVNGRFISPQMYAKLTLDVAHLASESQSLQARIGAAKKAVSVNDCFRDVAAKILDEKTMFLILEAAHDLYRERVGK